MLRTNMSRLVSIAVCGKVAPCLGYGMEVDFNGRPFVLPGIGSVVYNVKVGDSAVDWEGDHVEPAVSMVADPEDRTGPANRGLNTFACVGNAAVVVSGEAKGAKGVVTGHHGGVEHVIIDFSDKALNAIAVGDKIIVQGMGQGLRLLDYPEIHVQNCSPELLFGWRIIEEKKALRVPVTTIVPGKLMGSGVGSKGSHSGDYDIMTSDPEANAEIGLSRLRLGDLIAITEHDTRYGRCYRQGFVTFGVVIHSDSKLAGHGPGITTLITGPADLLLPKVDDQANIATQLRIGRHRKSKRL